MLTAFMPTLTVRAQDGNTEAVPKTYEECDAPVEIVNGDYSFKINKTAFDVGEPILITASGPNSKDWIGVYEWNKSSSRSWKYVDGIGDGVETQLSTFAGSLPEGEYVIRLQANDSSYFKDSKATVKIKVGNPDTGMRGDATVLSVDKKVYEAGEPIMVTAKLVNSDSWVGIYQFDQYGARNSQCSAFAWVDNPDKASSEVNMGDGVAFDITSVLKAGWTLPCGVYYIGYFPNAPTDFETVLASTTILIDGDTAASYDSIAPSEYWDGEGSGTVTPDPDEPTPDDNAIDLDELEQKGITGDTSKLSVEKYTFKKGEPIMVTAYGSGNDWVGIYGSLEQQVATKWHYLSLSGDGVAFDVTRGTALEAGDYYIRFVPNNENLGSTVTLVKVTVTDEIYGEEGENPDPEEPTPDNPDVGDDEEKPTDYPGNQFVAEDGSVTIVNGDYELYVNKTHFEVGEQILVSGKGSGTKDWIGIYPVEYATSVKYQYLENVGDGVVFDITENYIKGGMYSQYSSLPAGEYVIRLQANGSDYYDGHRALVRITIGDVEPSVKGDSDLLGLEKFSFKAGEPIMVTPKMAQGYTDSWVALYGFDSYNKGSSVSWEWVSTNGDGVAFDISKGATLPEGVYLVALLPYDNAERDTKVAYAMITVGENTVVSHFDIPEVSGGVTVSNGTHSMNVNKTKFEVGEEILVTANGVSTRDWIGIARRGDREATIRWYYITDAGNGNPYNIKNAPNIGGKLSDYADIPAGLYTIYLVENDRYLKDTYTFSINISVGDTEDTENGKADGGTVSGGTPEVPDTTLAPEGVEYTPSGNGYAGGTVTVTMPTQALGNYNIVMYWADANGPLEGYTAHAKTKVYSTVATYTFSESVIVPNGATRLIVYSENRATGELSDEFVSVELPQNSQIGNLGTPNASFFAISDVHIGSTYGVKHFKLMIKEAITLYPNGAPIFIAGDVTDHGNESEYQLLISSFNEVIEENGADASKYPMFFAIGNHDYPSATGAFLSYATLPDGSHPTDTCYDFWLNGYHYIFLGSDSPSGLNAYFNEDTLAWLDTKLAENRSEDRPSFIILHQSIYNTVSGSLPGEGWHGVTNEAELVEVISKYPEIVMFNGHSHWEMNSKGNIFEGTEELPIHAFNCASVSYLWTGFNTTQGENLYGSHGYAVDLYNGKIVVRGRDFVNSEWIASAQYSIDFESSCEHELEKTAIAYENGFGKSGKITYSCASCSFETVEECLPLISAKGYSLNSERTAINGGYLVNLELLSLYKSLNGAVKYGIVIASADAFGGKSFFNESNMVNTDKAIQVEMDAEYQNFNCSVEFGTTQNGTLNLVICAYVIDANGASFVQADSAASSAVDSGKIAGGAFSSVTLNSVSAIHPEKKDEE